MTLAGVLVPAAAGLLLLALAAHPFISYPLSLVLFARRLPRPAAVPPHVARDALPSVAICMSAFNEERVIEAKIESLLAMAALYGPATIHVYADAPTDRTAELLARYADRIDLVASAERQGKTRGLNVLVGRSRSELLLFTDANVVNEADALAQLVRQFADPAVGCASAQLSYTNPRDSATSAAGALYWALEERIKAIESATVGLVGVDGAMFMIRRELYRAAPSHLIDDLYVSLGVLIQGRRIVTVDGVTVLERSAVRPQEEYERKKRIACQAVNVHRALWRELRRMPALPLYAYVSHRLVKWMTPFLTLAGVLCLVVALANALGPRRALVGVALLAILLVLGDRLRLRPASLLMTALYSLVGVGVGVWQSLFGNQTYTVWTPATSVRGDGPDEPPERGS